MTYEVNLELQEKQSYVFVSLATEILFGGAAGGGKSFLLRAIATFYAFEVPGIQVYLFRRQVSDLEKNHIFCSGGFLEILSGPIEAKEVRYNQQKKMLIFNNGSVIHLCHLRNDMALLKFQGAEIHILLIDELTHFTENQYRYLRGRLRLGGLVVPQAYKEKLPLIVGASNPGNIGHAWVKRTFISTAPPNTVFKANEEDGGRLRTFIPSLLIDNKILMKNDPDYSSRLKGLGDPILVKAMLEGDWDIVAGGAFDDVWSRKDIVIKPFSIPRSWKIDRSFDWGSTHPFSVGWWAEADGTEATLNDGRVWCPPPRSLIRINEWYGADKRRSNTGIKLSSSEIAKGILEREKKMLDSKLIQTKPKPGPADNQIRDVGEKGVPTIEKSMKLHGVSWTTSDKRPGSRVVGLNLIRDRMKESKKAMPEEPAFYIFETCLSSIEIIPILPRDPNKIEDVDTSTEDHIYDEIRYRVLATARPATSITMKSVY